MKKLNKKEVLEAIANTTDETRVVRTLSGDVNGVNAKAFLDNSKISPVVTVAFVLLVAILLVCILAPVVAPYDPNAQDLTQVLAKPSAAHWLGCDQTGRDIFSRIIYGGRTALVSAVMVVVISVIIGIPLGLISGYKGGLADTIIMRCCDILLSFPSLLLAFVLVAGLGRNTFNAVLALGIVYEIGRASCRERV